MSSRYEKLEKLLCNDGLLSDQKQEFSNEIVTVPACIVGVKYRCVGKESG